MKFGVGWWRNNHCLLESHEIRPELITLALVIYIDIYIMSCDDHYGDGDIGDVEDHCGLHATIKRIRLY